MISTLNELVSEIKSTYKQETVTNTYFHEVKIQHLLVPTPKYLFRGEKTTKYNQTKTTFSRNLLNHECFTEINYWLTGVHPINPNPYALRSFLKETIWNISILDFHHDDFKIDLNLIGIFQHYGFDTAFIDLTDNINVAASFAATGNVGDIGKILVVETAKLNDQYFKLTELYGRRLNIQGSYVIWAHPEADLKSRHFIDQYDGKWFDFRLSEQDVKDYANAGLLSTTDDHIIPVIIDWYQTHIENQDSIDPSVKNYFKSVIVNLC